MKLLVLGASGFVGKTVSGYLDAKRIAHLKSSRSLGCDLLNYKACKTLFQKAQPDYVLNCAAHVGSLNYVTRMAAEVISDNSRMILNTYQALAEVSPKTILINPIANCAYPAHAETFVESEWMNGHLHRSVLSYGASKRLLWHIGESYYMQYGIKSIYLFVPNMYGAFDSTDPNKAHALDALISKFVKAEKENKEEIEIWGTGIAVREWLYAEDFARICESILIGKIVIGLDEPVNIAQNFGLSVRELVQLINAKFNNKFKIRWNHDMPDGSPRKVMDDQRFRKVFGDFNFTPLDNGIDQTIAYYRSVYPY
ncbi:MAG: NAD-dependent epimerase/dehydratase family protein [Bacteroidia bacterium]|jgi:GDP-L-fucose synthase|nr:NAD-dependent epimerase/dehydratase family protein [Bacteroidia bacterium]